AARASAPRPLLSAVAGDSKLSSAICMLPGVLDISTALLPSLARIPDDARIVLGAAVVERGVGHFFQIVLRTPPEQELRLGVVQPGGMIRRTNANGGQSARFRQICAQRAIVDRLVHADVERLLRRLRVIDR